MKKSENLIYWNCIKCSKSLRDILSGNNYAEAISKFQNGEYKALNLEKMRNYSNLYSIRIKGEDKADRLLFTCKPGSRDALILSVVENHNYDAAFRKIEYVLNNGVNAEDFTEIFQSNPAASLVANNIPDCEESIFYGKYVFPLSSSQLDVINNPTLPLIINGTAGSGKTVVAEQLLLSVNDNPNFDKAYYFAPTDKLVGFMRAEISKLLGGKELIDSSKIIISTYENYVKDKLSDKGINLRGLEEFKIWYDRQSFEFSQSSSSSNKKQPKKSKSSNKDIGTAEKFYAELCIAALYSEEEYISLGERQSSISKEERQTVHNLLPSYKSEIGKNNFDPNLQSLNDIIPIAEEDKGLVVVDESQSFSGHAINYAKSLSNDKNILFIGDSAQSMLSSVSNSPYIKSLFYNDSASKSTDKFPVIEINWHYSYRCPERVVRASGNLLKVKQSIANERQSPSIAMATSTSDFDVKKGSNEQKQGLLYFYDSKSKVKSFADQIKGKSSTDTVVIVPDNDYIQGAATLFNTDYVVTAKEFLGMGSHNVIMYKCFEKKASPALSADDNSAPALNEEGKIAINELFVSMTRAENSLTICETSSHSNKGLFDKMNLSDLHNESLKEKTVEELLEDIKISTDEDWKDKIIELIESGNQVVALRICESKFKDDAKEVFESCLNKTSDGNKKPLNEKNNTFNLGNGSPLNKEFSSDNNSSKKNKNKKKTVNILGDTNSTPLFENKSQLSQTMTKIPSEKNKKKSEFSTTPLVSNEIEAANVELALSQLVKAIYAANSDKVKELIQKVPIETLINYNNPAVGTLLHEAVRSNIGKKYEDHNDTAKILIEHIAKDKTVSIYLKREWLDKLNEKGNAALHNAARIGYDKIIYALKEANLGNDFKIRNKDLSMPVMPAYIAVKYDHPSIIKALGVQGVNIYADIGRDNFAHLAAKENSPNVIEALRDLGVNLEFSNKGGSTPAHLAAKEGNANVIRALGVLGVNLRQLANKSIAPIDIAVSIKSDNIVDVIRALAEYGVDLNARNEDGFTPLDVAVCVNNYNGIKALVENNVNISSKDDNGDTPAHIAAKFGSADAIRALGEVGADLDAKNKDGDTPADIAAKEDKADVIRALREARDNLKSKSSYVEAHDDLENETIARIKNVETDYTDEDLDNFLKLELKEREDVYLMPTAASSSESSFSECIRSFESDTTKKHAIIPIYESNHFTLLYIDRSKTNADFLYIDPRGKDDSKFSKDKAIQAMGYLSDNLSGSELKISETKLQTYDNFNPNNQCGAYVGFLATELAKGDITLNDNNKIKIRDQEIEISDLSIAKSKEFGSQIRCHHLSLHNDEKGTNLLDFLRGIEREKLQDDTPSSMKTLSSPNNENQKNKGGQKQEYISTSENVSTIAPKTSPKVTCTSLAAPELSSSTER